MDKPGPSRCRRRYNSEEIRALVNDSNSESEGEKKNLLTWEQDASDIDCDFLYISDDEEYDSDESYEAEAAVYSLTAKDGTQWSTTPLPLSQTLKRNIFRQKGGPSKATNMSTAKKIFKTIMTPEICAIILTETNKKAAHILGEEHVPFTEDELDAFFGFLLFSGVHRSNKEHIS